MKDTKDENGVTYREFETLEEANREMYFAVRLLNDAYNTLSNSTDAKSKELADSIHDFICDMGWPENINKRIINEGSGMKSLSYFSHNFKHFYDDGTKMAWEDAFRKAVDKTIDQLQSEAVHCPDCDCIAIGDDVQKNFYCFNCQKQFERSE